MRASVLQNGCNTSGKQSSPTTTPVLRYVSTRRQGGRRGASVSRVSAIFPLESLPARSIMHAVPRAMLRAMQPDSLPLLSSPCAQRGHRESEEGGRKAGGALSLAKGRAAGKGRGEKRRSGE